MKAATCAIMLFAAASAHAADTWSNVRPGIEHLHRVTGLRNTGLTPFVPAVTKPAPVPRDVPSMMAGVDWESPTRAASVTSEVPPGSVGRFTFSVRALAEGELTAASGLVEEGVARPAVAADRDVLLVGNSDASPAAEPTPQCPLGAPVGEAAEIEHLVDVPLRAELTDAELASVLADRVVVHALCVPGFTSPRFRVYMRVDGTPLTAGATLDDSVAFTRRIPGTVRSRRVEPASDDPLLGDPRVRYVRMDYVVFLPVVEDYTLRFVGGPYRHADESVPVLWDRWNAFAIKWTRFAARISDVLDGNARFEAIDERTALLRYDTFVSPSPYSADAVYRGEPAGFRAAILSVVRSVRRAVEANQRLLDGSAPRDAARKRALVEKLEALQRDGSMHAPFPADRPDWLRYPGP
jgi:hypothetical protein